MKTVFEYDNYREFLKDYYSDAKKRDKNFSFRYFARVSGFKACNVLKLVMDGKRNIAQGSIDKFAKGLKLNKEETAFFFNLVMFNQATNSVEKQKYSQELLRSKTFKKIHPLSQAQYHYYSHWYFTIVRGLVGLPGFREDPEWIAKQVNPPILASEASRAIEELIKLGLVERNAQGKLVQTSANVSSSSSITSSALAHFHREMLKKAGESIDRIPREKRDLSAMTIGISLQTAKKIKEMTEKFRREIVEVASQDMAPNMLYQLNLYLFPMAEIEEK